MHRAESRHPSRGAVGATAFAAVVLSVHAVGVAAQTRPVAPPESLSSAAVRAEDLVVGATSERYLKAIAVLQSTRERTWVMRGASASVPATSDGPWGVDRSHRVVSVRGGDAGVSWTDRLPSPWEDGPRWAGRGATAHVAPIVAMGAGPLTLRLAPELWWTQNLPFPLQPAGPFEFSDPAKGYSIDLPQRFGTEPVGRIDPGESHLSLQVGGARLSLTSSALRIGSGSEHAILLQGSNGGFPRLEAGVPDGFDTPLGRLTGGVGWGRLAQTVWAANRRVGARLGTYLVAAWTPPGDRVDLGVARFYHRDWAGVRARDLLVPFGSLFRDDQTLGLDAADNQLAVLFARVRAPEAGLEVFGEFGRNDRSNDTRDVIVELEHNSAWLLGVQRVWHVGSGALRSLTLTGASGRIPAVTRYRGQASFYEHTPLPQGHTQRGQLLGTSLLERDGGAEVRFDEYTAHGGHALVLTSRAMAHQRAEAVAPEARRHEWGLLVERRRRTAHAEFVFRAGGIADLGRGPAERDWYAVQLGAGVARLR